MAAGAAVVYDLAAIDLVSSPSGNAVCLDAVFHDEIVGIPFDQGGFLAAAPAPSRDPRERREK